MIGERELLQALAQAPASGAALARRFALTRAAVSKRVQALRAQGIGIVTDPACGYRLDAGLSLLDPTVVGAALPPALADLPVELAWSIDSTQAELLRRPMPLRQVLLAERQTAGRGRRGRVWASPLAAHLYLSIGWSLPMPLSRLGGLSLVMGAAVVDALRGLGFAEVGLKWPNDLFARGRKLGGILVDVRGEAGGPVQVVIGVGINVHMPVAVGVHIDQPWIDLVTLGGGPIDRNPLAAAVVAGVALALQRFDAEALEGLRARWSDYDALAARMVWVDDGRRRWCTRALGIAVDGGLMIEDEAGSRVIHAGEVSLRADDV